MNVCVCVHLQDSEVVSGKMNSLGSNHSIPSTSVSTGSQSSSVNSMQEVDDSCSDVSVMHLQDYGSTMDSKKVKAPMSWKHFWYRLSVQRVPARWEAWLIKTVLYRIYNLFLSFYMQYLCALLTERTQIDANILRFSLTDLKCMCNPLPPVKPWKPSTQSSLFGRSFQVHHRHRSHSENKGSVCMSTAHTYCSVILHIYTHTHRHLGQHTLRDILIEYPR